MWSKHTKFHENFVKKPIKTDFDSAILFVQLKTEPVKTVPARQGQQRTKAVSRPTLVLEKTLLFFSFIYT